MAHVVSRHDSDLGLPLGGPVLRPDVPALVKRWSIIKGHPVVKSWLAAKVIEVIEDKAETPAAAPSASAEPEALHPLDRDADGHAGGSLPAQERGLDELRGQYAELFGIEADKRLGEKRLRDAVDAKLAE